MTLGYLPTDGWLHRAHPFTPVVTAIGAAALAFLTPAPVGPTAVLTAVIVATITTRAASALIPAAIVAAPFWIFLFLIHGLFRGDPATALGFALRITSAVAAFLLVVAVVHPGRLVDALLVRRVPFSVAYLFAAALQVVPRFRDRGRAILEAQRCRGLRLRGSPVARLRAVSALAVPLVLSALGEVDEHALALETRGVGTRRPRTVLDPPRDRARERVLRWAVFGLVVVSVWWKLR